MDNRFAILTNSSQLIAVLSQTDSRLPPSYCCFMAVSTKQRHPEDSSWQRVITHQVAVYKATVSRATKHNFVAHGYNNSDRAPTLFSKSATVSLSDMETYESLDLMLENMKEKQSVPRSWTNKQWGDCFFPTNYHEITHLSPTRGVAPCWILEKMLLETCIVFLLQHSYKHNLELLAWQWTCVL